LYTLFTVKTEFKYFIQKQKINYLYEGDIFATYLYLKLNHLPSSNKSSYLYLQ